MPSNKSKHSTIKKVAVVAVFLFAIIVFFRENILNSVAEAITRDQANEVNDDPLAILLMGDSSGERAYAALNFLNKNQNTKIVIEPEEETKFISLGLAPPSYKTHEKYMLISGISEDRIIMPECVNTSTLEEALCLRTYVATNHIKLDSLVVITSWYHSSRAGWIFEKVFADTNIRIKTMAATSETSKPQLWWTRERSFLDVFNEYLKWAYWLVNSGKITYQN